MALSNIQGVASSVLLLAPENGLDVLHLPQRGLCAHFMLMELLRLLTSVQAKGESKATKVLRLEELVQSQDDSESLRVACARVNKSDG